MPSLTRITPIAQVAPFLAELLAAPARVQLPDLNERGVRIASYNVHRWAGVRGGRAYVPDRALAVLDEMDADVVAAQEVLRPDGDLDPLRDAARELGYHLAFVVTRQHKRGQLGNAVLSRWPIAGAEAIDLSFGRLERRAALAVRLTVGSSILTVAATHLALVDRTRARQVRALLEHPRLAEGPAVLIGDMNAWRPTAASRSLDSVFSARHHNKLWPASYPSVRPVMALDRIYVRGAHVITMAAHETAAARKGSDHLPIVASIRLVDENADGIIDALQAPARLDQGQV